MSSTKKTARLAGLLFLMMVVFGLLAEIMFRQKLFVANDVALTANNIISNSFVYRAGIISDILMSLFYLFTAFALYKLLSPVDKHLASTMVVLTTAGCVILLFNILIELAPLYILTGKGPLSSFNTHQQQALAMFFYSLYQHGYMLGQIFFALWVLPLGILIIKSVYIPKILGVLFITETLFGLMAVIVHFLIPNDAIETLFMLPMMVAEFSFMLYLLIRGINDSQLVSKVV